MSAPLVRCLVCGGRGGWWGGDGDSYRRATCSRCTGTGWELNAPDWLVDLTADARDFDGFTPGEPR